MTGSWKACFAGLIAACFGACTEPECTLVAEPDVVVEIRDALNDEPLTATAHGVVRQGAYTDSRQPHGAAVDGALVRSAAYERAGVYSVIVEHEGHVRLTGGCRKLVAWRVCVTAASRHLLQWSR